MRNCVRTSNSVFDRQRNYHQTFICTSLWMVFSFLFTGLIVLSHDKKKYIGYILCIVNSLMPNTCPTPTTRMCASHCHQTVRYSGKIQHPHTQKCTSVSRQNRTSALGVNDHNDNNNNADPLNSTNIRTVYHGKRVRDFLRNGRRSDEVTDWCQ